MNYFQLSVKHVSTPHFRFDDIQTIIKTLKNHKKIKDMANVLDGNKVVEHVL